MSRVPLGATLLVALAAATMIGLGFWQIARLHQKQAQIARASVALANPVPVPWPHGDGTQALYRRSALDCVSAGDFSARAGRDAAGRSGWAHTAACRLNDGRSVPVVLGWSPDPSSRSWPGGAVRGFVAPGERGRPRLIADPPLAGLTANAPPDPRDLPNNHLAYAVQWFLFAATAVVIYAIALRRRLAAVSPRR